VRALATRLRVIFESTLGEVELWNKSAASQLDAQLRERRKNFAKRLEAIERIQSAAVTLDDRIIELGSQDAKTVGLDAKLVKITELLLDAPPHSDHGDEGIISQFPDTVLPANV
jgi:uncharacterized protein (UPF0335 family)